MLRNRSVNTLKFPLDDDDVETIKVDKSNICDVKDVVSSVKDSIILCEFIEKLKSPVGVSELTLMLLGHEKFRGWSEGKVRDILLKIYKVDPKLKYFIKGSLPELKYSLESINDLNTIMSHFTKLSSKLDKSEFERDYKSIIETIDDIIIDFEKLQILYSKIEMRSNTTVYSKTLFDELITLIREREYKLMIHFFSDKVKLFEKRVRGEIMKEDKKRQVIINDIQRSNK